jgi:hypothetical protein
VRIEEQCPGIRFCGPFYTWVELRSIHCNARHVGQNKLVGVGLGVRQMSAEEAIDGVLSSSEVSIPSI